MKKRMPIGTQLGILMVIALTLMVVLLSVIIFEFKATSAEYQAMLAGPVKRTMALQSAQDDFHQALSELRAYIAYGEVKYTATALDLLLQSGKSVKKVSDEVTWREVAPVVRGI